MSGADDGAYVVEIKPSARRRSRAGEWVRQRGLRRQFATKLLARQWARILSTSEYTVWVQDTRPADGTDADGYLLARRARRGPADGDPEGTQDTLENG